MCKNGKLLIDTQMDCFYTMEEETNDNRQTQMYTVYDNTIQTKKQKTKTKTSTMERKQNVTNYISICM